MKRSVRAASWKQVCLCIPSLNSSGWVALGKDTQKKGEETQPGVELEERGLKEMDAYIFEILPW